MDFDLDDPLGDLLSDGSNDSFFGTSKKKTEKTKISTKTTTDTKVKSKVADLFGFENENTIKSTETPSIKPNPELRTTPKKLAQSAEPKKKEESILNSPVNLRQSIKRSTPERSVQQASAIATDTPKKVTNLQNKSLRKDTQFDDSDDFLNELGFDPKNPRGIVGNTKKSNILDDILNFNRNESATTKSTAMTTSATTKSTSSDTDRRGSRPTETNPTANRYSPSSRRPRNLPRSGSGSSDADPLGLFTSPSKQTPEPKKEESFNAPSAKSKPSKKPTVDWLGLDAENDVKPDEITSFASAEVIKPKIETVKPQTEVFNTVSSVPPENVASQVQSLPISTPIIATANTISTNLNMINMASLDKEHALQSLQQQETQLRIAAQMKQQEGMLQDMHIKQQNLIKQQENQFNDLLRRQIDRQNQLETQIQRQQEQINAYINVLMNQPSIGMLTPTKITSVHDIDKESRESDDEVSRPNVIELEADVKRLELEKLRLEDILQSVQTSHDQELEILQLSHKKQIALLEESLESLEKRLREEIKSTESYHLSKISALQTDMEMQQQKYEEHIEKLISDYEKQIEKLRLGYEQDLEALKNDQRSTIENIRQAKLYEFATLQESGSYLSTLKSASDNLEHATGNLESMRTNITTTIERIHAEREVQLNAKEQRLNEQQKTIEKTVEKTEEERTHLIELVKSLEIKLNSVEQTSTEEQWNLRQKSAALEAEKVSFEREKTFIREKLAAEEKRVQESKEMQFSEHKRLMEILDAEREKILVEKAKLETMERLKAPSNTSTKRPSELDAAIKIAQDATNSADIEREIFLEQQRKHESKKRELKEKESMLQAQQSELEMRISQAKDQKQVAEHATKTCKALEQKLLTKLQSLQENYMELTEREAKLSHAKMELGKERMELQHLRKQLRQSKCSLCRIGVKNTEISELDPLKDISANVDSGPLTKFDFFTSNSFDGLQQRLSNVEAMIDDVIINVPQSPKPRNFYHINPDDSLPNANLLSKTIIDPF